MGLLGQDKEEQKPLFRVWANRKRRAKTKPENIKDLIIRIRLSSSEEWILIEGKESVGLINADSKVGRSFLEFVEELRGELKQLIMIPAKGKLGFDIEPVDNKFCVWEQDEDTMSVTNNFFDKSSGDKTGNALSSKLTLENMQKPMPS